MFEFASIIGIYSYIIFSLGILKVLYTNTIVYITLLYFVLIFFYYKFGSVKFKRFKSIRLDKTSVFFVFLIVAQALVNFIGALGPELSFDALWYHLTIPKLFLQNHSIYHISGNLLYYSDMPKTVEMLYLSALSFNGEVLAKLISFFFGLLSLVATYKLSRLFFSEKLSIIASLIFYSSLVVGWQSITAYVDLGRTFFEIVALYEFIKWLKSGNSKNLIKSSIMTGLSISVKIAALNSLAIFVIIIFLVSLGKKNKIKKIFKDIGTYILFSVFIPLPWFIFSFLNTNNPFYPLFNPVLTLNNTKGLLSIPKLFLISSDPISPIYLIFLPLIVILFKKFNRELKILIYYCCLAVLFWYIDAQTGGSRFILSYLPAFSIVCIATFIYTKKSLRNYLYFLIMLVSVSSIGYRFLANVKYIPVVLGRESKTQFLSKNLNFSFGDFYDTDNYFKDNLKNSDVVLLYGFHNLYYVDFNFIDSSWVKKGDLFNYVATQNSTLPVRFSNWKQVYYNKQTNVRLYSLEGEKWVY